MYFTFFIKQAKFFYDFFFQDHKVSFLKFFAIPVLFFFTFYISIFYFTFLYLHIFHILSLSKSNNIYKCLLSRYISLKFFNQLDSSFDKKIYSTIFTNIQVNHSEINYLKMNDFSSFFTNNNLDIDEFTHEINSFKPILSLTYENSLLSYKSVFKDIFYNTQLISPSQKSFSLITTIDPISTEINQTISLYNIVIKHKSSLNSQQIIDIEEIQNILSQIISTYSIISDFPNQKESLILLINNTTTSLTHIYTEIDKSLNKNINVLNKFIQK